MGADLKSTKPHKPGTLTESPLKSKKQKDSKKSLEKTLRKRSKKALKSKPKTKSAPTPQTPAPQEPGTLPPPHLFDIVPPLHALLARLLLPSPGLQPSASAPADTNTTTAAAAATSNNNNNSNSTAAATAGPSTTAAAAGIATTTSGGGGGGAPAPAAPGPAPADDGSAALDIHNLDAAANAIRSRLQKARAAVKALPDVELTVAEQDEEIRELEDRIAGMRAMIGELRAQGGKAG